MPNHSSSKCHICLENYDILVIQFMSPVALCVKFDKENFFHLPSSKYWSRPEAAKMTCTQEKVAQPHPTPTNEPLDIREIIFSLRSDTMQRIKGIKEIGRVLLYLIGIFRENLGCSRWFAGVLLLRNPDRWLDAWSNLDSVDSMNPSITCSPLFPIQKDHYCRGLEY